MINRFSRDNNSVRSSIGGGVIRRRLNVLHVTEDPQFRCDNVFAQFAAIFPLTGNEQKQVCFFSGRNCNIEWQLSYYYALIVLTRAALQGTPYSGVLDTNHSR